MSWTAHSLDISRQSSLTARLPNVLVCLPSLKDCPQHNNVLTQIFYFVPPQQQHVVWEEMENKRWGKQNICFWKHNVMTEYMSVAASETTAQALSPLQLRTKHSWNKNLPHTMQQTKLRDRIPVWPFYLCGLWHNVFIGKERAKKVFQGWICQLCDISVASMLQWRRNKKTCFLSVWTSIKM